MSLMEHCGLSIEDNEDLFWHGLIGNRNFIFDNIIIIPCNYNYKIDSGYGLIIKTKYSLQAYDVTTTNLIWNYEFLESEVQTFSMSDKLKRSFAYDFNKGILCFVYSDKVYYFNKNGFIKKYFNKIPCNNESTSYSTTFIKYIKDKKKFLISYIQDYNQKFAWMDSNGNIESEIASLNMKGLYPTTNGDIFLNWVYIPYNKTIEIWASSRNIHYKKVYNLDGTESSNTIQILNVELNQDRVYQGNALPIINNNKYDKITIESLEDSASYDYKYNNSRIGFSFQTSLSSSLVFDYVVIKNNKTIIMLTNPYNTYEHYLEQYDIENKIIKKKVNLFQNQDGKSFRNIYILKDKILIYGLADSKNIDIWTYDFDLNLIEKKVVKIPVNLLADYRTDGLMLTPSQTDSLDYYWK